MYSQEAVVTRDARNAEVKRFYYLDIQKTLDDSADLDKAILSVPHDRKLRNFRGEVIADYPTPALEYEHEMLPLNAVLDTTRYNGWQMGYLQHAGGTQIADRRISTRLSIFTMSPPKTGCGRKLPGYVAGNDH